MIGGILTSPRVTKRARQRYLKSLNRAIEDTDELDTALKNIKAGRKQITRKFVGMKSEIGIATRSAGLWGGPGYTAYGRRGEEKRTFTGRHAQRKRIRVVSKIKRMGQKYREKGYVVIPRPGSVLLIEREMFSPLPSRELYRMIQTAILDLKWKVMEMMRPATCEKVFPSVWSVTPTGTIEKSILRVTESNPLEVENMFNYIIGVWSSEARDLVEGYGKGEEENWESVVNDVDQTIQFLEKIMNMLSMLKKAVEGGGM